MRSMMSTFDRLLSILIDFGTVCAEVPSPSRQKSQFEHLECLFLFALAGHGQGVRDRMWVAVTRPRRTEAAGIGPHGSRPRHGTARVAATRTRSGEDQTRHTHVHRLRQQATYPPRPDSSPGPDSTRRPATVKITGTRRHSLDGRPSPVWIWPAVHHMSGIDSGGRPIRPRRWVLAVKTRPTRPSRPAVRTTSCTSTRSHRAGHHHPQPRSCTRSSSPGHETASVSTVTKVSTAILRAFAMVRLLTRADLYRRRGGCSKYRIGGSPAAIDRKLSSAGRLPHAVAHPSGQPTEPALTWTFETFRQSGPVRAGEAPC
jgi:hypothetical protein